ncbi:GTP cyclohydrolase II [archaeon SCG-AAA382B04]|nr:GTP cyclohydrolase II [archaeon SCG-AAA382B04]
MPKLRIEVLGTLAKKLVGIDFPTSHGKFELNLYEDEETQKNHLALLKGNVRDKKEVLVRLHSKCLTGDVFGSLRCDCCSQLDQSLEIIDENGEGVLLYLNQEGRGIGLKSKIHSYKLQDQGYDTVEANKELGYEPDTRDYEIAASILKDLEVKSVKLLSNNPDKIDALEDNGIKITERVPLNPRVTKENIDYLKTKSTRLNHHIDLEKSSKLTPERERILRFFSRKINEKNGLITLFYKQNLNGELIKEIGPQDSMEKKELNFLKGDLKKEHDETIQFLDKLETDKKNLNHSIFFEANPKEVKKAISKDLADLYLILINPNQKGIKVNKFFPNIDELKFSKIGNLFVIYGENKKNSFSK